MADKYSSERMCKAITEGTEQLGYAELRPNQALGVKHFLGGKDVFVCLPTGSGKSLCYCLLPKVFDIFRGSKSIETQSIVIVVSPLVALMKDQVKQMTERNMRTIYVGDVDSETENVVCDGKYQLVYLSPEALLTNMTWRDMLQSPVYQQNLVALVVDEAHCVKKW
jgi:superfamily II DNA helicase RecQ